MAYPTCQTQGSRALPAAPTQQELVGQTRAREAWHKGTPDQGGEPRVQVRRSGEGPMEDLGAVSSPSALAPPPPFPIRPAPGRLPQAGPGLPSGSPSARPAPARPPCRHSLGKYGDGCDGSRGNPTWGSSATRSSFLTAQPQGAGACPGSAAVPTSELTLYPYCSPTWCWLCTG